MLSPFDPTNLYVQLTPKESAILADLAHGAEPPEGVFTSTWSDIRRGDCGSISFADFGRIVDAIPDLLEQLHRVRA